MDRYSQRMERADLRGGVFLLQLRFQPPSRPEKQIIDISSNLQFSNSSQFLPLFGSQCRCFVFTMVIVLFKQFFFYYERVLCNFQPMLMRKKPSNLLPQYVHYIHAKA